MAERNSDRAKYVAYVLWLNGTSLIATAMQLAVLEQRPFSDKQVWSIIKNSPFAQRSKMTTAERQNHLDNLAGLRMDDGRLKASAFKARDLKDGRKARCR